MLQQQLPCFVPVLPMFHDDGIRACVEPVGMSAPSKKQKNSASKKPQGRDGEKRKEPMPACGHNSWDNVRVIKGQVTLRCRVCQVQWRTHVDAVWRKRKCGYFNTPEGCVLGEKCPKLHLHARKQSLSERVDLHGVAVLAQVPAEAIPKNLDGKTGGSPPAQPKTEPKIQSERPCTHNTWDNVRVKKGLVTLRCRVCQGQWRRPLENLPRCLNFPSCGEGDSCPNLHLHAFKQSLTQRIGTQGNSRVPQVISSTRSTSSDGGSAITLCCDGTPLNWPQVTVVEGVQGWYDSTAEHRNIPEVLLGGVLLQGTSTGISVGLKFTVKIQGTADVYVMHETGSPAFANDPMWEAMTPSLARSRSQMDGVVTLPTTEKPGQLFSIIVKQLTVECGNSSPAISTCGLSGYSGSSSEACLTSDSEMAELIAISENLERDDDVVAPVGFMRLPATPPPESLCGSSNMFFRPVMVRPASCPPQ